MEILNLLSKIIILIGILVFIVSAIIMTSMLMEYSKIGPNLSVCMLSVFYSIIAKIIIEVIITKKKS